MVHFFHCVDYTTFTLEMIPSHDRGKSEEFLGGEWDLCLIKT